MNQQKKDSIFHLDFSQATDEERRKIAESYKKTFESKSQAEDHISAINYFLDQEGLPRTTTGQSGNPSEETINRYRNQVKHFNQWLLNKAKGILIKTIRIKGFRGLENIEVDLEKTTVLTGMNNSGKSSVLHALEIALGHRFVSQEDFFIKEEKEKEAKEIVIDLFIIPINADDNRCDEFSKDWDSLFNSKFKPQNNSQDQDIKIIPQDDRERQFVSLRTKVTFDNKRHTYKSERFIRPSWPENKIEWFKEKDGEPLDSFVNDEMPFFYMDGQRDILKDIQSKTSYLGKMLSKTISFNNNNKINSKDIEKRSEELNKEVIKGNDVLKKLEDILKELNSAIDTQNGGIKITLFTEKIRDLYKGLSIHYTDQKNQEDKKDNFFPMEYHGMGTRSWSSLLTLKAFTKLLKDKSKKEESAFLPIVAIEEPEAHLHPNAQKRLYRQIDDIEGQKIISTHSPYIAAVTDIKQVRNLYKDQTGVHCGQLDMSRLDEEGQRKIERQVMKTRGEILFSKSLILCEGETEEQALPIFAEKSKKYFKNKEPLSEIGLNVIGVGGHNYRPFLKFANSFKIPLVIFSDADTDKNGNNIKEDVQKQLNENQLKEDKHVVFLDDGENFETQLMKDGFENEIKEAIIDVKKYRNSQEEQDIRNLTSDKLKRKLGDKNFISKASLGPAIAKQIINSDKNLPPRIKDLFEKVFNILEIKQVSND